MLALILAAALAPAGPSVSTQLIATVPDWRRRPSISDVLQVYPRNALARGLSGLVVVKCVSTAQGGLSGCAIVSETPGGQGFGDAALKLMPDFEMRPATKDGQPIGGGEVIVPIRFVLPNPPGAPAHVLAPAQGVITAPDWAAIPTADQMMALYPKDAVEAHVEGRATIACAVSAEGRLTGCSVADEQPSDAGFGAAALKLSELFQMRPMTKDGQPVDGGQIRIPIRFALPQVASAADPADEVVTRPVWLHAASVEALQRTYPASTSANGLAGEVMLTCTATASGELAQCSAKAQGMAADQFQAAALHLGALLQMKPQDADGRPVEGRLVRLPLFYAPFSVATLKRVQVSYPGPHATALVNCRVLAGGRLDNCFTRRLSLNSEQVADAAAKLATTVVVDKGLPSQRRVQVPLELMPLAAAK